MPPTCCSMATVTRYKSILVVGVIIVTYLQIIFLKQLMRENRNSITEVIYMNRFDKFVKANMSRTGDSIASFYNNFDRSDDMEKLESKLDHLGNVMKVIHSNNNKVQQFMKQSMSKMNREQRVMGVNNENRNDVNLSQKRNLDIQKPVYKDLPADLPACPERPDNLAGREEVINEYHRTDVLDSQFEAEYGGRWRPGKCKATRKVAIIIPYRDRDVHLKYFLFNVIPKLQRQLVDYTMYLVEQAPGSRFNRGMIRNVGYAEAKKLGDYDCYIFNDIDTIIENDKNLYKCPSPKAALHMAPLIDRYRYEFQYEALIGGILSVRPNEFELVNGYSNGYFVWGAEDDDLHRRLTAQNITIERPLVGQVTTLLHERDAVLLARRDLYNHLSEITKTDGLNSMHYDVINVEFRKLYTWIYVRIDEKAMIKEMQGAALQKAKESINEWLPGV